MKPYLLQTLKEIALLGAIKNKIEISSLDLAKQIDISQQTASRYLLDLDKKGFIIREIGIKKQLIQITPSGEENLQKEFLEYQQIFELTDRIIFKGKIVSGIGEGHLILFPGHQCQKYPPGGRVQGMSDSPFPPCLPRQRRSSRTGYGPPWP